MKKLRSYYFPLLLLVSILMGAVVGSYVGKEILYLKIIADIFLNLMLTAIVPVVFFSMTAALSSISRQNLSLILIKTFCTFLLTGLVAAIFIYTTVYFYFPNITIDISRFTRTAVHAPDIQTALVNLVTVPHFYELFSHTHLFPLIIFAFLISLATAKFKHQGPQLSAFFVACNQVMLQVFTYVMYLAPLGFFAYFAVLVANLGKQVMGLYLKPILLYYSTAMIYLIIFYSLFAFIALGRLGVIRFWQRMPLPFLTALATCSGAASIPANLSAAKKMHLRKETYTCVVTLGAILHKDGTVMGAIIKIAFLFSIFHMPFTGIAVFLQAIGVALLVGIVMGSIPSGGMIGEILILSIYGFPNDLLFMIAVISLMIDPLATAINVTGDLVAAQITERWLKT